MKSLEEMVRFLDLSGEHSFSLVRSGWKITKVEDCENEPDYTVVYFSTKQANGKTLEDKRVIHRLDLRQVRKAQSEHEKKEGRNG
nr:hypothetical protein [Sicyoidochytrium minutum DNA virus]